MNFHRPNCSNSDLPDSPPHLRSANRSSARTSIPPSTGAVRKVVVGSRRHSSRTRANRDRSGCALGVMSDSSSLADPCPGETIIWPCIASAPK